jgi:hypothetical protein
MVIDLATRHVRERTDIEIETVEVEVVKVVWVRGAVRRRGRWRWSVRHGYGSFAACRVSLIALAKAQEGWFQWPLAWL